MLKKVVVIEKDGDLLEIVCYILKEAGYRVSGFQTEEGTLEKIIQAEPDIILLDIINISIEGTALCRAIKAHTRTKKIPVVVLSTHFRPQPIKAICAEGVVEKPFDIDELLLIVKNQLAVST